MAIGESRVFAQQPTASQRQTLSMSAGLKIGIVGATGAVGEEIVKVRKCMTGFTIRRSCVDDIPQ